MKISDKQDPYRGASDPGRASALAAFLPELLPESRVLDLGAGLGFDSLAFAGAGHRVTALDRSQEMLSHLAERVAGVSLIHKDARLWSPESASWDAAWANDFFPDLTPDEMHRVLGVLFRALVPGAPFGLIIRVGVGTLEEMPQGYDGPVRKVTLIDPLPMAAMLNQSGFQIEKEGSLSGNPSLRLMLCRKIS
jgi:SAM-dependent methyltransferase